MHQRLSLAVLPRALSEAGYEAPTYRRAYEATLNGTIPVKRGANGRWTFDIEDVPLIAERLGSELVHLGE